MGMGMGMGRARLERGRDGHRRRRERRRHAERAVRVVAGRGARRLRAGAITTAGSTVFLLACQLTFFTAMGTLIILTVAYSLGYSLLFFMRGSGVDFCGALASRVAPTASSRRESRIDGAEALLAQAFAPRRGPGRPRRRHLPLPEGPQVRVLPARVDSQFLRRASRLARYLPLFPRIP